MSKSLKLLVVVFLLISGATHAKEGMWIPTLLKAVEGDMQAYGLKLSAEDIYSINNSSLKDAVVHFGGGCTAEIISGKGLLLTNHHCGYGQIQSHSSVENDYLKNGFWAMSMADELANPGLTATLIVRIDDVTSKVLAGTDGLGANEARVKRMENIATIESEIVEGTNHEATVRPFNYGNAYYVIVTKTYNDVRLVGAPPSSVGKFGGDTDNWMWPRHTGDFSIFRIYANDNNEPAEYADSNVPYTPSHFFPVSLDGVEEGDFTMVFGFPGFTETYLTSHAVDYVMNKSNPMRISMRQTSLSIIDQAMLSSDKIRIQYAAKQSRISNAYKKWIGQNKGLKLLNALEVKREQEKEMTGASRRNGERIYKFEDLYKGIEKYRFARELFIEYYYYGPEFYRFAQNFRNVVKNYDELASDGKLAAEIASLKAASARYFKDYHQPTDKAVFEALSGMFIDYIDPEIAGEELREMFANAESIDKLADKLYAKSYFTNEEKMNDLLDGFSAKSVKKIKKDKAYQLMAAAVDMYNGRVRPEFNSRQTEIDELMKDHVAAMVDVFPDRVFWPDANSTLRLTYGKAEGSEPRDGMVYKHYTTTDGILQKYVPGDRDFDLPADLIELLEKKDFGKYGKDGELRVCFTGSNHTTGGNSGSPVLDGYGNLIGLNFDRSWESTMSDIMFDPDRCRNIMVDIRYVLFIVDKYAGASHLIQEMTLVRPKQDEKPEIDVAPTLVD